MEVVESICRKTPKEVNRFDSLGRSTMWHIAHRGDTKMFQVATEAYARCRRPPYVHLSDENGLILLRVACWHGHLAFIHELLGCGGIFYRETQVFGLTPAEMARRNGKEDIAESLEGIAMSVVANYTTISITNQYAAFCCSSAISADDALFLPSS